MVPTPGCWARDDIGAAFAGVFWGVLVGRTLDCSTSMVRVRVGIVFFWRGGGEGRGASKICICGLGGSDESTYGADTASIFLLRIGSDILANECGEGQGGGRGC